MESLIKWHVSVSGAGPCLRSPSAGCQLDGKPAAPNRPTVENRGVGISLLWRTKEILCGKKTNW